VYINKRRRICKTRFKVVLRCGCLKLTWSEFECLGAAGDKFTYFSLHYFIPAYVLSKLTSCPSNISAILNSHYRKVGLSTFTNSLKAAGMIQTCK